MNCKHIIASLIAVAAFATPVIACAQADDSMSPTPTATPAMHHRHHRSSDAMSSSTKSMHTSKSVSGRYTTEAAAEAQCPSGNVAWMNTKTHALHMKGDQYYGKTKSGAYVCASQQK